MSVTFEENWFAQGRFRNAYKGTWITPPEKWGQQCVVKEKKDKCTWNLTDWDTSVKIHKKSNWLAILTIHSLSDQLIRFPLLKSTSIG